MQFVFGVTAVTYAAWSANVVINKNKKMKLFQNWMAICGYVV